MSEHAALAPSSSEQWGHCSGSVAAQSKMPDLSSEQAREGTAAHWVMSETLLNHQDTGRGGWLACHQFIGSKAPNGVIIDDKMAEGAQVHVDDVLEVCWRFDALPDLLVEHRVYMPRIHKQVWGTLDTALYLPKRSLLFLWDYKHGHREAKPDGFQLINYLEGLVEYFDINGELDRQTRVVSRIVQPFCYYARGPVREWTGFLSDLRGVWNYLYGKAHEVFADPKLTSGPWCRDCKAVGKCSAARRAGYNYIDMVNEPYHMDAMTASDLAVERGILVDGLSTAKARLDAIEDELQHRIRAGQTGTGLALESGNGRLEWAVPPGQARALAAFFSVDATKEAVLTPTQTLALASKEIRPHLKATMEKITRRPVGKLKLVPAEESIGSRAFKGNN